MKEEIKGWFALRFSRGLCIGFSFFFLEALFLPGAQAQSEGHSALYPTNYMVSAAPAVVTVQFACSYQGGGENSEGMANAGYAVGSLEGVGASGTNSMLTVTNPAGSPIASLILTGVSTNITLGGQSQAAQGGVSVSGSGVGFSMANLMMSVGGGIAGYAAQSTNFPAFTFGPATGHSNIPLTGTDTFSPFVVTNIPTNAAGFAYASGYTGNFTFYADTNGSYAINGAYSGGGASSGGHEGGDTGGGYSDAAVTILSISSTPLGAAAPMGKLTATQNAGGAGGVTLQWSITPGQ